jgi:hypothetical protein
MTKDAIGPENGGASRFSGRRNDLRGGFHVVTERAVDAQRECECNTDPPPISRHGSSSSEGTEIDDEVFGPRAGWK